MILVAAKAASGNTPSLPNAWERVLAVAASSFTDVLFALACGVIAETAVWTFARWIRTAALVRGCFLAFFAIAAGYAVVAVGLFRYFNKPLTFELFTLVGNAAAIRSSLLERVTLPIALGVILAPTVLLFLATRMTRNRLVIAIGLAAAVLWVTIGWSLHRKQWNEQPFKHLWLSPHAELLRSTAVALVGGRRPSFTADFPPEYMDDFRTFGARQPERKSTFQRPADVVPPRNVIVVILESVGTKYLHLYGHPEEVTPTLTAESQHALVFDNIYAHASFTYASFRPLNFSVYPGLPWHYSLLNNDRPLPRTLASALKARGSRTAYFTSGDLDWGAQRWLLTRQSDYDTLRGGYELGCENLSSWGTEDRCLFDRLIEWIDEKPGEPFFAVCWTDQTHDPYRLSPGTTAIDFFAGNEQPALAADLSRYLHLLHNADAQLARVFAALRERGLAEDTLVVITGDHGEAFADPHDQRGHARSVYEEEVHVPLMIWNPRLFPQRQRLGTIGGHVDLNPTLSDLLGIEPPREWQGHSLFDPARPNRAFFMAIAGGDVFGVREGDWKYIYDVTSGRESLFNLRLDPQEQHDFARGEPERALQLRQRVAAWVLFEDAFLWSREN